MLSLLSCFITINCNEYKAGFSMIAFADHWYLRGFCSYDCIDSGLTKWPFRFLFCHGISYFSMLVSQTLAPQSLIVYSYNNGELFPIWFIYQTRVSNNQPLTYKAHWAFHRSPIGLVGSFCWCHLKQRTTPLNLWNLCCAVWGG